MLRRQSNIKSKSMKKQSIKPVTVFVSVFACVYLIGFTIIAMQHSRIASTNSDRAELSADDAVPPTQDELNRRRAEAQLQAHLMFAMPEQSTFSQSPPFISQAQQQQERKTISQPTKHHRYHQAAPTRTKVPDTSNESPKQLIEAMQDPAFQSQFAKNIEAIEQFTNIQTFINLLSDKSIYSQLQSSPKKSVNENAHWLHVFLTYSDDYRSKKHRNDNLNNMNNDHYFLSQAISALHNLQQMKQSDEQSIQSLTDSSPPTVRSRRTDELLKQTQADAEHNEKFVDQQYLYQ